MKKKYIAIIICVIFIALIVLFSNIFLIKTVEVVFEGQPKSATKEEILTASQIELNTNIFNLNEKRVKENICRYVDNNLISVIEIERQFPNKVKLVIKERRPIIIVPYKNSQSGQCIPTDIDFQLVKERDINQIDFDAIWIKGVYADKTFNINHFLQINEILKQFLEIGFTEESLIAFISEIEVKADTIHLYTRFGDGEFIFDRKADANMKKQVSALYGEYNNLDYDKRNVFIIDYRNL